MAKVVFDFSELITNCLHNKKRKFTNAIKLGINNKEFIAELFRSFQFVSRGELEELLSTNHFHFVESSYIKEKISEIIDDDYLYAKRILQIPLGKEPRLYGTLQKIKHTNFYLFQALLFDPNHLIYEEKNFAKLRNLACLFREENCY